MHSQSGFPIASLTSIGGAKMNIATIDATEPILVARGRDPNIGWHGTASGIIDQMGARGMSHSAYPEGYLIVASRIPAPGLHSITQCYHLAASGICT